MKKDPKNDFSNNFLLKIIDLLNITLLNITPLENDNTN